MSKIKIC